MNVALPLISGVGLLTGLWLALLLLRAFLIKLGVAVALVASMAASASPPAHPEAYTVQFAGDAVVTAGAYRLQVSAAPSPRVTTGLALPVGNVAVDAKGLVPRLSGAPLGTAEGARLGVGRVSLSAGGVTRSTVPAMTWAAGSGGSGVATGIVQEKLGAKYRVSERFVGVFRVERPLGAAFGVVHVTGAAVVKGGRRI